MSPRVRRPRTPGLLGAVHLLAGLLSCATASRARFPFARVDVFLVPCLVFFGLGKIPPGIAKVFDNAYDTGKPYMCQRDADCHSFVDACRLQGSSRGRGRASPRRGWQFSPFQRVAPTATAGCSGGSSCSSSSAASWRPLSASLAFVPPVAASTASARSWKSVSAVEGTGSPTTPTFFKDRVDAGRGSNRTIILRLS